MFTKTTSFALDTNDISSQILLNKPDGLVFLTLELSESEQSFSCRLHTYVPVMLSLVPAPPLINMAERVPQDP